jgi:hypothetical protein
MSQDYVKKIRFERYAQGKEIDTDVYNYGYLISAINLAERELVDGMIGTAEATGARMHTLWKFVAELQKRPQPPALVARLLEKDGSSQVDLSDYISGLEGMTVFDIDALRVLRKLTYLSRDFLKEGYRPENELEAWFRESLFERLRSAEFPNAPSRATCFFLFLNLETALAYAREHRTGRPQDHLFCNVKAARTRTAFEADMKIFDQVELKQTFACAAEHIRRYWRQERSEHPMVEVLFQGEALLGEPIRLSATCVNSY